MTRITPDFCYRLNGRGGGSKMDLRKLKNTCPYPVWIHIDYKDVNNQAFIHKMGLDRPIIENLLDSDTSPRYFTHKNGLLIVIRGINTQKSEDIDDMIALHIWLEKNRILTLSHRFIPSVQEAAQALKKGRGAKTPADCFLMLAHLMTDKITTAISKIDTEVDDIEEAVIEQENYNNKDLRQSVSQLRHKIVGLRRYIVPQRDVIKVMKNLSHPLFTPENKIQLRDIYFDLNKAVEDLNYARDHSNVTQEELDSKTNLNISHTMYIMSIVMVLFAPLTFITGLLGANIGGIPFDSDENGFLYITVLLLAVAALQVFLLKKMKWF